jgi:hypothetical protein
MKVAGVDAGVVEAGQAARSKPGGRIGRIRYLAVHFICSLNRKMIYCLS